MTTPAGWYPSDGTRSDRRQWWNGQAWTPDFISWDARLQQWAPAAVPSSPAPPPAHRVVDHERMLLDITAVGKGGGTARIKVTTTHLRIEATAGLSTWKATLGVASLGVSYLATGIASGRGGQLELPVSVVSAAYVKNERMPWADLIIVVAGDSASFHMAWASAVLVSSVINAAIAGGAEAAMCADAWAASRRPRSESTRDRNKRLRVAQSSGILSTEQSSIQSRRGALEDNMRRHA